MSGFSLMTAIDSRLLEQLRELIGGDSNEFHELIGTYLTEAREMVAHMHSATESKDLDSLRRLAHSLKSSSQDFGASELSELSATLESHCRQQWPANASEQVELIKHSFSKVESELELVISHG